MKNIKSKRFLALFVLIVSASLFATGCTINVNIGNSPNDTTNETLSNRNSDTTSNMRVYQSRAAIYISNKVSEEKPAYSSSDLIVSKQLAETYAAILNTSKIQNKIKEEYPNIEYELTLEPINETEICAVIATSEHPEKLEDICNLAVSLLCEEVSLIVEGSSCKVIDNATPAQLVGTN